MQLSIDVSEKDLAEFGRESIQKEMDRTIKWLKLKQSFHKISQGLKDSIEEESYLKEIEEIRESVWKEYKKDGLS